LCSSYFFWAKAENENTISKEKLNAIKIMPARKDFAVAVCFEDKHIRLCILKL
jgi:hypothetical protein